MKRIIQFTLTISLFFTTVIASAQSLGNRTACDMEMTVVYGFNNCQATGTYTAIVPAFSVVPIPMPPGQVVIASRGLYVNTSSSCVYVVGLPCTGYSTLDNVQCNAACGPYNARLSNWGVVVYH